MLNEKPLQNSKYFYMSLILNPPFWKRKQNNQNKIHTEETTLSTPQKQVRNTFAKEPSMLLPVGVPGFGKGR